MKIDILKLAQEFETKTQSLKKTSGGKERMSRAKMMKALEKAKNDHKSLKSTLDMLEANDAKLKGQLEQTKKDFQEARAKILKYHNGMQHSDLANASDVVFYDDDTGYVIDGKEYHLDVDDGSGDLKLTLMSKHRKAKKAEKAEPCMDANCADDSHQHPKKEKDEEDEEEECMDTNDSDDQLFNYLNSNLGE